MQVKLKKLRASAELPRYQTPLSAGMDLVADLDEPIVMGTGERCTIPTGIAIALPAGFEGQVRGRSGLGLRHGITLAQGVGTIDADYRGEIHVLLVNNGSEPFMIEHGMRIAQLVVARHERVEWEEAEELDGTGRGERGFGSTGV